VSALTDKEQMQEMLDRKVGRLREQLIELFVSLEANIRQGADGTFQISPYHIEKYKSAIDGFLMGAQEASDLAGDLIVYDDNEE